jgi:hypothetical protein
MNVSGKKISVETIKWEEREIKENDGGCEFKYNIL